MCGFSCVRASRQEGRNALFRGARVSSGPGLRKYVCPQRAASVAEGSEAKAQYAVRWLDLSSRSGPALSTGAVGRHSVTWGAVWYTAPARPTIRPWMPAGAAIQANVAAKLARTTTKGDNEGVRDAGAKSPSLAPRSVSRSAAAWKTVG